jgi:hypothetical protein
MGDRVPSGLCACGRPLHYTDTTMRRQVQKLVDRLGADVVVTVGDRSWAVQRHYIALHGLKPAMLPVLDFPEITASSNHSQEGNVSP